MSKIIIYLIGFGGSGKTSAAQYLEQKYGFAPFAFGAAIREYASANGLPLKKRQDYAHAHAEMLKKNGWDYTLKIALGLPSDRICIDDVRPRKYAARIRKAGGVGIAFDCPTELRFAHVHDHPNKAKYPETLEAFMQNEREDEATIISPGLDFETTALMESADYHVDASGSLEQTLSQVDTIVNRLITEAQ